MSNATQTVEPTRRRLKRLRPALREFYPENRHLLGSKDAFRKRLERRYSNGLAASGAVVETSLGLMIDPPRFRAWLLQNADKPAGFTAPRIPPHGEKSQ